MKYEQSTEGTRYGCQTLTVVITQHENCFLALFTYSDHSTENPIEYKSAPQRGRTEYATMAGITRSAQMYLMINGKAYCLFVLGFWLHLYTKGVQYGI